MSSTGYEMGTQVPTYESYDKAGSNLSSETQYYKSQFAPQLISRISSLATTATPFIEQLTQSVGKNAASTAGKSALGSAAKVGGYIQGGINTLMNGMQAYADAQSAKEKIDGNTIMSTADQYTDSKFGQSYKTYGAADTDAIMEYVKQRNKVDKTNMALSYGNTGASALSTIGSIFGPIGSGLGLLFGYGIGATVGLNKGDQYAQERTEKAKMDVNNANNSFYAYNQQSESVAGSKGLRQQYGYADKGKSQNQKLGYPGKIGMVHTPNGIELGIQYGLGGGGETIMNPNSQSASVIEEGKKRVDNIPVGVPINSSNPDKEWADTIILGNTKNKNTGKTIADEGRDYARLIENDNKKMDRIGRRTQELNKRNAYSKLMNLANIQAQNHQSGLYKADAGKVNWGEYASMIAPRLMQFGAIQAANQRFTPTVTDPYAHANVEGALNALGNLHYDPSQAIQTAKNTGRQTTYMINHSGGISGGQKVKMNMLNNYATARLINDIGAQYADKNIESKRTALGARIQAEDSNANRRQQANVYTAEAKAKAEALPYQQQQAYFKSLYDMFGAVGKDLNSYYQNLEARKYKNLIMGLYNKQLEREGTTLDALAVEKPQLPTSLSQMRNPYLPQGMMAPYFNTQLKFKPTPFYMSSLWSNK